jgi:putative phosphoserine phosphatase/1-acylglycerol-3-phosphate O-acyltransferase
VPIVPIVLRNTGELQWRGSRLIRSGSVDVLVLPPISVADWDPGDLDRRVAAVRQLYVDALDDWQAAVASA